MVRENGSGEVAVQKELLSSPGYSLLLRLLLTSAAASLSETATYPLDIVKTREQLKKGTANLPNSVTVAARIFRERGIRGYYQGLSPAILRHCIYTSSRIVVYEQLRGSWLIEGRGSVDEGGGVLQKAVAGGVSGVIGQAIANPADLIKVRMQADGRYPNILAACKQIYASEGIPGLYRGLVPNVQRAFLVNMGELACYDFVKRKLVGGFRMDPDDVRTHALSSVFSGLCATALSCPADVVKTRMMNQEARGSKAPEYKNALDCLRRTVATEGYRALWKGFFPTWARLGPWQLIFWTSYERMRSAVGLATF